MLSQQLLFSIGDIPARRYDVTRLYGNEGALHASEFKSQPIPASSAAYQMPLRKSLPNV
jgi:hypothetical protein